jgi:hypothetical protein
MDAGSFPAVLVYWRHSKSPVIGHAVMTPEVLTFVMLDGARLASWQVSESCLTATAEEGKSRSYQLLHDQLSPN